MKNKIVCKNPACGKLFRPKANSQKFCTARCRERYKKKLLRDKKKEKKKAKRHPVQICANPECSKEFIPKRLGMLYCSVRCQVRVHNQRTKEKTLIKYIRKYRPRGAKPSMSLSEVNELARAEGLSYGQYFNKHGYGDYF